MLRLEADLPLTGSNDIGRFAPIPGTWRLERTLRLTVLLTETSESSLCPV
jgi:hypothetical protein